MKIVVSDLLVSKDIGVIALSINGVLKWVEMSFKGVSNLLAHLNGNFRQQNDLRGLFTINNNSRRMFYSNPEGFKKIELMSVFQEFVLVFKMGTAPDTPYPIPYTVVARMNNETVESKLLEGMQVMAVAVDNQPLAPGSWGRNGNILLLPEGYANKYITVVCQQTAPSSTPIVLPTWYLPA